MAPTIPNATDATHRDAANNLRRLTADEYKCVLSLLVEKESAVASEGNQLQLVAGDIDEKQEATMKRQLVLSSSKTAMAGNMKDDDDVDALRCILCVLEAPASRFL